MKIIAPDYYNYFKCIAGSCRHSCCKGWEIDIDEESLSRYMSCPGAFGERLRENIELTPENEDAPAHFKLSADERCPFLNSENLCDMFTELGEESLCQICTDHPRFRNFWSDRTEMGLGMACEEAARIILSWERPMTLEVIEDDEADAEAAETGEIDDGEQDLLDLRAELMAILQDRTVPTDTRVLRMLDFCGMEPLDIEFEDGPVNETACEQLAVYFLYRDYADALYDGKLAVRIRFVAEAYARVRNEWARAGKTDVSSLVEAARSFSEAVEYDSDTWDI